MLLNSTIHIIILRYVDYLVPSTMYNLKQVVIIIIIFIFFLNFLIKLVVKKYIYIYRSIRLNYFD